ncbi:hypothetical protein L1281_000026 [Neisseria sp. HSC-16F19]|nr:endonuclease NucS domain-containing protein [Neisseria sp. HSC-16F19]MCP2039461.1 hypothetical protein [Neisseria sp. HSC-16F19]
MYKVDISNKNLIQLNKVSYAELKLRERFDIQEWIDSNPSILGEELLIIGKEVALPSGIRLDLLAIDRAGNLVVIELKRDDSGNGVEWQAIKYASYCAAFADEDIFHIYNEYLCGKNLSATGKEKIEEFIYHDDGLDNLNIKQRIILVARVFHPDVASAALWLRDEYGVDITCLKLEPFSDQGQLYIQPTIMIPLPEAKDYLQRQVVKKKENQLKQMADESLAVADYPEDKLRELLRETLQRESPLTLRLIEFFKLLLTEDRTFDRLEVIDHFEQMAHIVGTHKHGAGGMLSNVSQFLTKPNNAHLRQIISFEHSGYAGSPKTNYYIMELYRDLLADLINELE